MAARDARAAVRRHERERRVLRELLVLAVRALRYHREDIDCGGSACGCDQCLARDRIRHFLREEMVPRATQQGRSE